MNSRRMSEQSVLRRKENEAVNRRSRCILGYDKTAPASGLSPKNEVTIISVDDELVLVKMTMFSVLYIRSVCRPDVLN